MPSNFLLAFALSLYSIIATCDPTLKTIDWFSCEQNNTVTVTCGTLVVPLDYTDPASNKMVTLELVKITAAKQPTKGSVLFNPGGPGGSGRDLLLQYSSSLLVLTGGFYDVIGFDTR